MTPIQRLGAVTRLPGFPPGASLAVRYAALTGLPLDPLPWHLANANFRLAALYEYQRRTSTGRDDYYADPALVVGFLVAGGRIAGLAP